MHRRQHGCYIEFEFSESVTYICISCHTLQTRTFNNTFLFCIRQRTVESSLFVTACYAGLVILVRSISEENVTPICPTIRWFSCNAVNFAICKSFRCSFISSSFKITFIYKILQALINQSTTIVTAQSWAIVNCHI
ncbi:Uncharacterised protein [Segatella copri]|nr:Uncharacterised protein [Segatella copri]